MNILVTGLDQKLASAIYIALVDRQREGVWYRVEDTNKGKLAILRGTT